jgi:hypothetical protein
MSGESVPFVQVNFDAKGGVGISPLTATTAFLARVRMETMRWIYIQILE